jgi:hypothetical protein
VLRKKLAVLLASAMMLAMALAPGVAVAAEGGNGHHYGEAKNGNSGNHFGHIKI